MATCHTADSSSESNSENHTDTSSSSTSDSSDDEDGKWSCKRTTVASDGSTIFKSQVKDVICSIRGLKWTRKRGRLSVRQKTSRREIFVWTFASTTDSNQDHYIFGLHGEADRYRFVEVSEEEGVKLTSEKTSPTKANPEDSRIFVIPPAKRLAQKDTFILKSVTTGLYLFLREGDRFISTTSKEKDATMWKWKM